MKMAALVGVGESPVGQVQGMGAVQLQRLAAKTAMTVAKGTVLSMFEAA